MMMEVFRCLSSSNGVNLKVLCERCLLSFCCRRQLAADSLPQTACHRLSLSIEKCHVLCQCQIKSLLLSISNLSGLNAFS